jgi:hypothetical protein
VHLRLEAVPVRRVAPTVGNLAVVGNAQALLKVAAAAVASEPADLKVRAVVGLVLLRSLDRRTRRVAVGPARR